MATEKSVRDEIASDLRQMADILDRERLVNDISPLRVAEVRCRQGAPGKWRYGVERLLFRNLGKGLSVIPRHVDEGELVLEFSFLAERRSSVRTDENPFDILEIDIHIHAQFLHPTTTEISRASCAWHLDFHTDKEGDRPPAFVHPAFHFQHGGRLVDELRDTVGPFLVIDSPRLAHPPMDAILGIDFVLTNFVESSQLRTLRANNQYRNVLKRSQERLWKPYFHSLASVWPGPYQEYWQPNKLLPQLIA